MTEEFTMFPINLKISNEVIDNIMERALNEGTIHWCLDVKTKYTQKIPIQKIISNGGTLLFYAINSQVYSLTKRKFIVGAQQAIPFINSAVKGASINAESIDADGADLIIQLALFNELYFD